MESCGCSTPLGGHSSVAFVHRWFEKYTILHSEAELSTLPSPTCLEGQWFKRYFATWNWVTLHVINCLGTLSRTWLLCSKMSNLDASTRTLVTTCRQPMGIGFRENACSSKSSQWKFRPVVGQTHLRTACEVDGSHGTGQRECGTIIHPQRPFTQKCYTGVTE